MPSSPIPFQHVCLGRMRIFKNTTCGTRIYADPGRTLLRAFAFVVTYFCVKMYVINGSILLLLITTFLYAITYFIIWHKTCSILYMI